MSPPVCSMSRIWGRSLLRPRSGRIADAVQALERLVPVDVLGLGRRATTLCVFHQRARRHHRRSDDRPIAAIILRSLSMPAARMSMKQHLRDVLSDVCTVEVLEDRALLALQGPAAEAVSGAALAVVRIDAVHGYSAGLDRRREIASSADPAIPVKTASRSAFPRAMRNSSRERCCRMRTVALDRSRCARQPAHRGRPLPLRFGHR